MRPYRFVAIVLLILLFSGFPGAIGASSDLIWDEPVGRDTLKSLREASGLRVLWWNIHDRGLNSDGTSPLAQNLEILSGSNLAPDLILLAEYRDSDLPPGVLEALQRKYPYQVRQNYPGEEGYGVVAFSRHPLEIHRSKELDYTPLGQMSESEMEDFRKKWCSGLCTRTFLSLRMTVQGRTIGVFPIHLYDAWRQYRKQRGTLRTGVEVLFGENNPVWFQLNRFFSELNQDLQSPAAPCGSIVIGDFNTPKKILGLPTPGYQSISRELREAVPGNSPTFPARSGIERSHYPRMRIDHAFSDGHVQALSAAVLPLQGSEHYPLYAVFDLDPERTASAKVKSTASSNP